ncbi:hypothetical protein MF672_041580 [Actinomadura sp. ATCC 31491]|uniref:DUF3995 domain-containing protein n=1 Tax=Actinomadura luzonensis TaxID=2805427 RepID=A0ABT0G6L5_9ACTN|nr:hypothetical protein [Actinomadura luzonensis]MCK2220247.1 hypothetical protein [Actinomadura luzonensis]
MSTRSRLWWAAALLLAAGGFVLSVTLGDAGFFFYGPALYCPGRELSGEPRSLFWNTFGWLPPLWSPAVAVAAACFLHWLGLRRGRPVPGRAAARVLAAGLLLYLPEPLGFAFDMVYDPGCLDRWYGARGAFVLLTPMVPTVLSACCVLAAVRRR